LLQHSDTSEHGAPGIAQQAPMQRDCDGLQQSDATVHSPLIGEQIDPPQMPSVHGISLQQFLSSVQALPFRTHRQRPMPSLFFRPVLQTPVQQSPSALHMLSFREPFPQGPSVPGLPAPRLRDAETPADPPAASPASTPSKERREFPLPRVRTSLSN
jgi:hypothetical protein